MPPLVVLILRILRYTLTRHHRFAAFLSEQVSARALSLLLCAVCLLVTHLLLTEEDVFYTASKHTHVHDTPEQPLDMVLLIPKRAAIGSLNTQLVPLHKNSRLSAVDVDFQNKPVIATAHLKNKDTVKLPYLKHFGNTENIHPTHISEVENGNGGILHYFHTETQRETLYYLSPRSWNSLAVKLFLRGEHNEAFVPVYPENRDTNAPIKIWKIRYPHDVVENPKHLKTALEAREVRK